MKSASAPIGYWIGVALTPKRLIIELTEYSKSAPVLSILLIKTILGTLYFVACLQTVSVCGSTPFWPSNTATAPSKTRNERSTSTVKSTCPGVSIRFNSWSFQRAYVAADVIVIPRSFSWTIQSIVDSPSCVSPILWLTPVWNKILSLVVVLPASIWAIIPKLRYFSIGDWRFI